MLNKILDGCHVKKASLVHTVKYTFKLECERISEDVDVPQQPVQFLLQACHGRDVEGNRVNDAARRVVTLCISRPRFSKCRETRGDYWTRLSMIIA